MEGVAEGCEEDVAGLEVDDAAVEAGERRSAGVWCEKGKVALHLVGGVAEPHCLEGVSP